MNIKSISLVFAIVLLFNTLAICQTENQYSSFAPVTLKENAKYNRNFAPNNYDEKILYQCFTEMVDLARAEYRFLPKLKHDVRLDSTAMFQADFQASKDEKTLENNAPYKTTYFRLRKYGLSGNGDELVTKVKAYMGENEYSYYDLCLNIVSSFLKNVKTADVLLNEKYSYMGFGYNTDLMMKNMYVSIVLGNDRTFNEYKAAFGAKDLPYTKGQAGLKGYDDKICKKCASEPALEVLSEYVSVNKNGDIYITCDNYKELKRLIGKDGDAIAIDFIQEGQYECDKIDADYDLYHRGVVTKPITFEKIFAANENSNLKNGKLISKIGSLPDEVTADNYDIVVLVLKEGNRVCRSVYKKSVQSKGADYQEKINFLRDKNGIKSAGEWAFSPEESQISASFAYEAKKTDYTAEAFKLDDKSFSSMPDYKVNSITLISHISPDYYQDPAYKPIMEKRANFMKKELQKKFPGMDVKLEYDYCWDKFKETITQDGEYYDLSFGTLESAAKELRAYNRYAAKTLDSAYLAPLRTMELVLNVTFYADNSEQEEKFVMWKYESALNAKNIPLAMAIEDYTIDQIEKKNYSLKPIDYMISVTKSKKEYQTLLNNQYYAEYLKSSKLSSETASAMRKVHELNNTNPITLYNTAVCDVVSAKINSVADVAKTQALIDRLYSVAALPKDRVNSLNLEYQFKIINYLDTVPATQETTALLTSTYAKIKEIRNPKMDSWKNAFKLASYFNKRYDYMYSLSLMTPFLDDPTISEDFIFSYVSIAAHREETYLSSLFTKAVQLAADKNTPRLCGLVDQLPTAIFENEDARKIICKACNR